MEIFFATSNPRKFLEAREILNVYGLKISHLDVNYPEIQTENLIEIAIDGVRYVTDKHGLDVFVEDAGLFIKAINGFPGPYSSYVYKTIGPSGILNILVDEDNREAIFRSVVAFCDRKGDVKTFVGETRGFISYEERGIHGFAFDSIFIPESGDSRTFSEMSRMEKNEISHRRRSLEKLAKWIIGTR
ncbi:MAG: XTP/dITP diphosphatase [Nitrososphaeria archaeon]|nr:XTP/dITP diphosphatase [Nitrososphaeria archaeon]